MWAALINILLGLWLMIAPSVLPLERAASNNHYITGPLVITFAIVALWEVNHSARYLTLAAGAWLVFSPFVLGFESSAAVWSTETTGLLLAGFSLVKRKIKGSYGGGWLSLFQKAPPTSHFTGSKDGGRG